MMNRILSTARRAGAVTALALSLVVLAGCASSPETPSEVSDARKNLQELKNDPNLAGRARVETREAEQAGLMAEETLSESDPELADHRMYMASQKVKIARAKARTDYLEDQRQRLAKERDAERLANRTQEADRARSETAELQRRIDKRDAEQGERDAERLAKRTDEANQARSDNAQLQRRIDELQAESTERGIVLTLGDVLFTTGSAELQRGGYDNLDRLVAFLDAYPERDALVEGHTDSVGPADSNDRLSKRRADSVQSYLVRRGVDPQRLSTDGMGESRPIATNDTAAGRERNRRVEIIIDNPQ
jgi:outer membrane protein OmpA-like peptidoglycan-associated protein